MLFSVPKESLSKHPLFIEHIEWLDKNWPINTQVTKLPCSLLQSIDAFGLKLVNRGLFNVRRKAIRTVESSLRSLISILKEIEHVRLDMRNEINGFLISLQDSHDFVSISRQLPVLDDRIRKMKIEIRESTNICPEVEFDCGSVLPLGTVNLRQLVSVAEVKQTNKVLIDQFEGTSNSISPSMFENEYWVVETNELVLALLEVKRKHTRWPYIDDSYYKEAELLQNPYIDDSLFSKEAESIPNRVWVKVIECLEVEYSYSKNFCKLGFWLGLVKNRAREDYLEFQLRDGYARLWLDQSSVLIVVTSGQSIDGHEYPSGTWWVKLTKSSGERGLWNTMSEMKEGIGLRLLKLVIECEQLGAVLAEVEASAHVSSDSLNS